MAFQRLHLNNVMSSNLEILKSLLDIASGCFYVDQNLMPADYFGDEGAKSGCLGRQEDSKDRGDVPAAKNIYKIHNLKFKIMIYHLQKHF